MASASSHIPGPNIVLGTSKHAPKTGPNLLSPVYGERNASGLYDAIADQVEWMGPDALANLEGWSKNHRYVDRKGDELRTAIVGEIAGPEWGTVLRAHGNYFSRNSDNFKPIDDDSKIKDTLAITVPTNSSTRMYNTVLNEVIALGQVTSANADEDAQNDRDPIVKNWTKASKPDSENHDVIMLTMLSKYAVPSANGAPKPKRTAKRKLDEVDDEVQPAKSFVAEETQYPADADIKLGAHYEPSLLCDYGGAYFNHSKAKLVQLDVRDAKNNLIPPWKFYDALKPGTLILAMCSLHCYTMAEDRQKKTKDRKIYQLNAHTIRVLAESDEYIETRTRPIAPGDRVTTSLPQRPPPASFDNFIVPAVSPPSSTTSPHSSSSSATAGSKGDMEMDEDGKKKKGRRARKD
ncbi:hypothetical protein B0H13DRAFT_1931667 [Mycena leptocephala]|nr:hypothetical protein B0H13DRAFT_1931667 [Mycena leptocephala]